MKKRNKWIISSALLVVIILTIAIVNVTRPKEELGFEYAKNLYQQENINSPQNVLQSINLTNGVTINDPLYNGDVVVLDYNTSASFNVILEEAGVYNLLLNLYVRGNGLNDNNYSLVINDVLVSEKVNVYTSWQNEFEPYETDLNGNDIMPMQVKVEAYEKQFAQDFLNKLSKPLALYFESGLNTILITMTTGNIFIAGGEVVSIKQTISYEQYLNSHSSSNVDASMQIYEAEYPYTKNDNSIEHRVSKDVNVTPYQTKELKLNTIVLSKADFTQSLTYQIEAPETGYYALAVNYYNSIANKATFFRFAINGEVPFGELYHYPLFANKKFNVHRLGESFGDEPFKIYLEKGLNLFSITTDATVFSPITDGLSQISEAISSIYLQLRTLSVQEGDTSREWTPEEDFPGIVDLLTSYSLELKNYYDLAQKYNGSNLVNQGSSYIQSAYQTLLSLLKKPQYLPNNNATLAEGSGSISQNISAASLYFTNSEVSFDKVILASLHDKTIYEEKSSWFSFWEGVKRFFGSFAPTLTYTDEDALEIWVSRPTMYVDLMQDLADSTFTKNTGIKVNFVRLADEGKIILSSAAGSSPDAVLGLSNWLPYELGIRHLTYDLRKFSDYNKTIKQFSPGALIPLVADDIGLGLPETQDFYVTFYRHDLINAAGISVPNTWDEVINLLPSLQRKGMNYYVPLSSSVASKSIMTTAPFIQQMGGELFKYNDDYSISTSIDSPQGIDAVKLMTNLYLLYGVPLQVNNFFDSFRNGSLPIGVSTLETYLKLQYAAPELTGKWDIALAPGMEDENGQINRYYAGSATSMIMMNKAKDINQTWELMKWWSSAEIQTEFSNNLRKMYGSEYIYNSANLNAFMNSTLPENHKQIILAQWEHLKEYPRVPGWYMLERELSNTWNNVVLGGENVRTSLDAAIITMNKEIRRKMLEFGYLSQTGEVLKIYKFANLEDIKGWQQQA